MDLTWEVVELEAEHPFRISRSTETRVERVWVRVEGDGLEGWGEADPSDRYGETAGTVERALDAMRSVIRRESDPGLIERLERELRIQAPGEAAALSAVVSALCDLAGKRMGVPLWRLWGLDPAAAPVSSFTIGIDEPGVVAEKVRAARGRWPILKVKLGTDRDRELMETVRRAAPDAVLRVDANEAWSPGEALDRMAFLAELGVELVEQPIPADDLEGLRHLRENAPLPLILDESVVDLADVPQVADAAHGINIKLGKCGGPREALRMIHAARASGLRVMLGCFLSSSLAIAAAAHLSPLADYADLDGAALLADDPFRGPRFERGRIVLDPEAPGLGVSRAAG